MDSGVPVIRFYVAIIIVAVIGWIAGYFHGQDKQAQKESDITIEMQEKALEIHTEVYSNLPRSRSESFDWLYDHTD